MRSAWRAFWLYSILTMPLAADETAVTKSQLMQLNRASQQKLKDIQRPSASPATARQRYERPKRQRLNHAQRFSQQALQERQRRELLMQHHAAKTVGAGRRLPVKPVIQRQRFRQQQQHQLNRFKTQQRLQVR